MVSADQISLRELRERARAAADWMPDLPWSESRHCHPATLGQITGSEPLGASPSESFGNTLTPEVVLALVEAVVAAQVLLEWAVSVGYQIHGEWGVGSYVEDDEIATARDALARFKDYEETT